jgi:hypothetical protein
MFDRYKIVGDKLFQSTSKEVDEAEGQLGILFPSGYREYVTVFGEGVLGGSYIRIYPPDRILRELPEWRKRIDEYWFWDAGHKVLTKEEALQSVIVGDTLAGDELIVHPGRSDSIFVLPRQFEDIFVAGDRLPAAIEWLCSSGTLCEPFSDRNFEPFSTR